MSEQVEVESIATEHSPKPPDPNITVAETKLFSGLNALGWSAGVAVLTALATCAGMIREAGRSSALAIYSLSRPAIDQRDIYKGMSSLLTAALFTLVPFAVSYLIYRLITWALAKTILCRWFEICRTRINRFLPAIALILVLADIVFLNATIFRLTNEAEGVILKHTPEAGTVWTDILLDNDFGAASAYMFLFGAGVALFVGLSWWLIDKRIKRRLSKIVFLFWSGAQVLLLLLGFSYLMGVTDTIGQFPVVAFSGVDQLGSHLCTVLLGSDDRQFAILVINCQEKPEGLQKYVLYLPRTEVKWMTVIRLMQLQPLARLDDLRKLSQ